MHPREFHLPNSTRPQRLLLVDGFQDEAEMYSEFFAHCGFRVQTCDRTEDAFTAALAEPPDIVVTRIRQSTGQRDGIHLTARLRRASQTRDVPVVIITTSILRSDYAAARSAGCNRVVVLPVTPEELLDEIQAAIGTSESVLRAGRRTPREEDT
jgi:CheY-like chemotaxis protein